MRHMINLGVVFKASTVVDTVRHFLETRGPPDPLERLTR
jgi:hypothetical protein